MHKEKPMRRMMALLLAAAVALGTTPVTVMAAEEAVVTSGEIVSFEALPEETASQAVELNTAIENLNLPETLTATVRTGTNTEDTEQEEPVRDSGETESGNTPDLATESSAQNIMTTTGSAIMTGGSEELGQSVSGGENEPDGTGTDEDTTGLEIPVTWAAEPAYDPQTQGQYVFTPELGEGFSLAANVVLPTITVTVSSAGTNRLMGQLALTSTEYSYQDENGEEQTAQIPEGNVISSGGSDLFLNAGWYVATGTLTFSGQWYFNGDVHLILADDAAVTINASCNLYGGLTIYGQAAGSGGLTVVSGNTAINGLQGSALTVNGGSLTVSSESHGISADNITVNGGSLTASAAGYGYGISADNITVNGGTLTASSEDDDGIYAENITVNGGTLTASSEDDYGIRADSITVSGGTLTGSSLYVTDTITLDGGMLICEGSLSSGATPQGNGLFLQIGSNSVAITTPEQLKALADYVNAGNPMEGVTVMLREDINLSAYGESYDSGKGWTPIGSNDHPFKGTFDGVGRTVTGLYCAQGNSLAGLFGKVRNGSLKNLRIEGADISTQAIGGILAGILVNSEAEVCAVTGTVSGSYTGLGERAIGGLFGGVTGSSSVKNCFSGAEVTVTAEEGSRGVAVGGAVGLISDDSTVEHVLATGKVSAPSLANSAYGGIAGYVRCDTGYGLQSCVALNPGVSGTGGLGTGRVTGYIDVSDFTGPDSVGGRAAQSGNFAYSGMEITSSGDDRDDGTDVSASDALSAAFWRDTAGLEEGGLWTLADNRLPVLGALSSSQSGDIPDYLSVALGVAAAKNAIYADMTQAAATSETVIENALKATAETAVNNSSVTVTINKVSYTAPTAGTAASPAGTNGSYTFTVTVAKGTQSDTTVQKAIAITATIYSGITDEQAVNMAKTAAENATYANMTQAAATSETVIENALKATAATAVNNSGVTVTINKVRYTAPVAGTSSNSAGTNGGYTFTVTVAKGGQNGTTAQKTITITATPYSGGSGGSSDSGGSATSAKRTEPVSGTVGITATVNGENTIAAITEQSIADAIASARRAAAQKGVNAGEITAIIQISSGKGDLSGITVNLPKVVQRKVIDAKLAGIQLVIDRPDLSIGLNNAAITEINRQANADVQITATKTDASKLGTAANGIIGSRPAYRLTTLYQNGAKSVTDFGNGKVFVGIPYQRGEKEAVGYLYAAYVNEKGAVSRVADSAYDANSKSIIFTTDHFSVYGVGYTAPSAKFMDIANHWAAESINYVVGRGLLSGTSETTFSPDTAMTRGTLVTALGRLAGVDVKSYTTSSFTDVKSDSAFRPYIEWAYKKGVVQGTGNGKFEPDRAVTREEIAVIFANFAKATGYTLPVTRNATTYADLSSIGSACKTAVTAMQQAGIMMGGTGNKFNPKASATRAEVSSMLHRYIKLTIDPATAQGWALNDDGQYLYYRGGAAVTGWQTIDGLKYYFYSTGVLQTGWVKDGNDWRFYSANTLLVGFWNLGANGESETYYFTANGSMVFGKWLQIGGKWYYFYADGKLAKSTKIDGYEVDASGVRKMK